MAKKESHKHDWFDHQFDMLMKMILVGDSAVGKSSLFDRYCDDKFADDTRYASTIGVDFKVKTTNIKTDKGEHSCKLQIWDTAGQERFKSITQSYYRGSHICVVCFDVNVYSGARSITSVNDWIQDIRLRQPDTMIYIIGTRYDEFKANPSWGSQNREIENNSILTKDDHFLNSVHKLTSQSNVRFVGVCSAKDDEFIPLLMNKSPEQTDNSDKIVEQRSTDALTETKFTIDDMFNIIIQDFVEMMVYTGLSDVFCKHPHRRIAVNIDDEDVIDLEDRSSTWCCGMI